MTSLERDLTQLIPALRDALDRLQEAGAAETDVRLTGRGLRRPQETLGTR